MYTRTIYEQTWVQFKMTKYSMYAQLDDSVTPTSDQDRANNLELKVSSYTASNSSFL